MEVLRRAAPSGSWSGGGLVERAAAARHPARGLRHRHGRAGGRGAAWPSARRPARPCGRDLCAPAGAQPHSSGGQRQPGRPHRRLALRPAHRGLRAPAGHWASGRSNPDQRPYRGPRLRPGDDRAAAFHLHGLHRHRPGRDDRRGGIGRDPRPLRMVGAAAACGRLARDPLAAARERDLARPPNRGGARRAARRRLRLPPGGRSAGQQGVAPLRPRRLDHRPFHRPAHPPARAAIRRHPYARAPRPVEPAAGDLGQCAGVLAAGQRGGPWPHLAWGSGGLRAERGRGIDDRLRWIELVASMAPLRR